MRPIREDEIKEYVYLKCRVIGHHIGTCIYELEPSKSTIEANCLFAHIDGLHIDDTQQEKIDKDRIREFYILYKYGSDNPYFHTNISINDFLKGLNSEMTKNKIEIIFALINGKWQQLKLKQVTTYELDE